MNPAKSPDSISLTLVCFSYPPVLGGSEIEAQRVCAALAERGHKVRILCSGGDPMPPVTEWTDPYGLPVRIFGGKSPAGWRGRIFAAGVAWTLRKERRHYQIAYFLMSGLHLVTGVPMARLLGKPVIMKFSGSGLIRQIMTSRLGRFEISLLRRWADRILILNPGMAEEAAEAGLPSAKVIWMPNPVDINEFAPCGSDQRRELRQELGLPESAPVVTFVGRLAPEKELPSLVAGFALAVRRFPETILALVGDGPERAALETQVREAGLERNVRFAGRVESAEVRRWLQASDAFTLVSSLEGFPCSLLEAMSVGLPAVVSRIPANTQLVEDGVHGWTAEPKNPEEIARGLAALFGDPDFRVRAGAAARQRVVENYSPQKVTARYEDLFRQLLPRPKGAAPLAARVPQA